MLGWLAPDSPGTGDDCWIQKKRKSLAVPDAGRGTNSIRRPPPPRSRSLSLSPPLSLASSAPPRQPAASPARPTTARDACPPPVPVPSSSPSGSPTPFSRVPHSRSLRRWFTGRSHGWPGTGPNVWLRGLTVGSPSSHVPTRVVNDGFHYYAVLRCVPCVPHARSLRRFAGGRERAQMCGWGTASSHVPTGFRIW